MPRAPRADAAGGLYHALNRGKSRARIFRKDADDEAIERILGEVIVGCGELKKLGSNRIEIRWLSGGVEVGRFSEITNERCSDTIANHTDKRQIGIKHTFNPVLPYLARAKLTLDRPDAVTPTVGLSLRRQAVPSAERRDYGRALRQFPPREVYPQKTRPPLPGPGVISGCGLPGDALKESAGKRRSPGSMRRSNTSNSRVRWSASNRGSSSGEAWRCPGTPGDQSDSARGATQPGIRRKDKWDQQPADGRLAN